MCGHHKKRLDVVQLLHYKSFVPEIIRFARCVLRMYADDHRPPHFHVVGPDFAVMVDLSSLAVVSGEADLKDIAEALTWAGEHQTMLARLWRELNEREEP